MKNFQEYTAAQNMARQAIDRLKQEIRPGMTEREIKKLAEIYLIENGSTSFWYHGIGALIHVGERSLVSQGGREYRVSDTAVKENDVITLDLAPTLNTCWGDFARTIFVEDGLPVQNYADLKQPDHQRGIEAELKLHHYLMETVTPDTTFEELFAIEDGLPVQNYADLKQPDHQRGIEAELKLHHYLMETVTPDTTFEELFANANALIIALGFENLDYANNLGHSVEILQQDRVYIEKGNAHKLSEYVGFTFEPHISCPGTGFGVKRENIYYFGDDGKLCEL